MDEPNNQDRPDTFDQILQEGIDEALLTIGEKARTSIYTYVKDRFNIRKQEIPR
jgi:hypothetical protein